MNLYNRLQLNFDEIGKNGNVGLCLRRTLSEQLGYFKAGRVANVVIAAVTFLYSEGWVLNLYNAAGGSCF